jgi:hypothetical protein
MTTTKPRTAAEINARRIAIGEELAKTSRFVPAPNARELEAEDEALKADYIAALQKESEDARVAAEVKARVEKAHQEKQAREREARIEKAVAEAAR